MRKFFTYIAAFILGSYLLLFACLHTDAVKNYVKSYIENWTKENTDFQITIGEISLLPPFHVTATNIHINHDAEIHSLSLKVSPIDFIINGNLTFHYLHIDDIDIKKIPEVSKSSGSLPFKIIINDLKIQNVKSPFDDLNIYTEKSILEGNVSIDPEIDYFNGILRFTNANVPGKTFQTTLSLLKDVGHFRLTLPTADTLEGKFVFMNNGITNLSELKGRAGPVLWEGELDIDKDWKILRSNVVIKSLELSNFTRVQGNFKGNIQLSGNILNPKLHAEFFSDRIQNGNDIFEKIAIIVSTQSKLGLDFIKDGREYHFSGNMTWDSPLSPKFVASLEIADIIRLIGADTSNIHGQLSFGVDFSNGTPLCDIDIKNFAYESYDLGCSFKDIECKVIIEGEKVTLSQIKGTDTTEGKFSGNGEMKLSLHEHFPFEVRLKIENTEIFNLDIFKAYATGDVTFKGNFEGAVIEAEIVADSIKFHIPDQAPTNRKNLEVSYINQPANEPLPTKFKKSGLGWPLEFNIKVKVNKEASVTGTGLKSEWKGKAVITGNVDEYLVNGEMRLKEGSYLFRGKQFDIKSGSIEFKGDIEKDTTMYVIAEMEIDRVTVQVIVKGSTQNPAISFRSTPPMSQREILSWILFNKGLSDISQFQGTQLNESITDLIKSADNSQDLLTRLQTSLGIDRLEFSGSNGTDGVNLQVGKYISKKTFLTLSRNTNTSTTEDVHSVGIETILRKNIKFQAEVDDDGNGQANLIWKKEY